MKFQHISILRSLSVIAVVAFHLYQMMYANHFPSSRELYLDAYFQINECGLINIAMPLFTFIAGFLFAYGFQKGAYSDFLSFIKKKAMRLVIPFLVFSILMMFTTGTRFQPMCFLRGGYAHLWYLMTLFWFFPLDWCLRKFISNKYIYGCTVTIFLFTPLLGRLVPFFLGLHNLTIWGGWFLLGDLLYQHNSSIESFFHKTKLHLLLLIPFPIVWFYYPVKYGDFTWYLIVSVIAANIGLFYTFQTISNSRIGNYFTPLIGLSKYAFGIYIFHFWFAPYLISTTAKRFLPLESLAANHIVLFPLCFTIITLMICVFVSYLLMKTKIGKLLIG